MANPQYGIYNGRQVAPYSGPAPATSGSYYATYNGHNVVPYGGATPPPPTSTSGLLNAINPRPSADANRQKELEAAAAAAGNFANQGEAGYGNLTGNLASDRAYLEGLRSGQNSLSAEQLRQGLSQQHAQQRSMAASASPQNAAMAARIAANNMARASYGMSGQAAMAGIAERNAAAGQLSNLDLQQRGQDIEVGLGSRQNQMTGLGANKPDKPKDPSTTDKLFAAAGTLAPLFSDERLKENIEPGDKAARRVLSKLAAKSYDYKDERHGKGKQLGFLAQDLERAGAKSAVVETPIGKAIDTGKLTGINTGLIASMAKRLSKLEGKRK